jgi:NADPH-dependent glutamate synthase beta subunit-like oxidoreductase
MSKRTFQVVIPDYNYWKQNIKCQTACPVNTDSRGYVRAISEGNYEKAYWIARIRNPLVSICGRICGAPCESACRRKDIDAAVSIRALKRFVTERHGVEIYQDKKDFVQNFKRKFQEEDTGITGIAIDTSKPISIIGSGPSGLACAHDLALMGYEPIIYEMEKVAGGMCAVGIPPYRLPREILQAEIDAIKALGVEIKLGVQIGKDIPLKKLFDESEAVLLAVGAKKSRMLPLEGSDSKGVLGGVDFLRNVFTGQEVKIGQKVIVIGGGDVAVDSARTALRFGAEKVYIVYRRTEKEIPSRHEEVEDAKEEGIRFRFLSNPKEILCDDEGRVNAVRCENMKLGELDESGRRRPERTGEEFTLEADQVIMAIGQLYDLSFFENCSASVEMTEAGMIKVDQDNISTSVPGLFVAGDLAYGPKLVINAVGSGKKAAIAIHEYLSGKKLKLETSELHVDQYNDEVSHPRDYEKIKRREAPVVLAEERIKSHIISVETGFTNEMAEEQGGRCLNCSVNTIFNSGKCILCGGCADICPEYCLRLVSLADIKGDEILTALYRNRYGDDPVGTRSAIIKDEDRCIRCGLCAKRCPVDAITMEKFLSKEVWVNE